MERAKRIRSASRIGNSTGNWKTRFRQAIRRTSLAFLMRGASRRNRLLQKVGAPKARLLFGYGAICLETEQYKVINPVRSEAGSDNMVVQPEPADPNERPPWE
jgi:hypothetical protein